MTAPMKPNSSLMIGVDKIGVRFGQEEKFLAAFHQADAGQAAGTNGDERLQRAGSHAPCGSRVGMEERFKTRAGGTARER